MSNQLAMALTPEITEAFKPAVIEVMKNTLAPTANPQEFVLFAHKAASYGLDPFKNEIFFIKYGNTARIQFAAEAYLSKAREKEGFEPPNTQMVHENDEFKASMNTETEELEVAQHDIGFPRGKIIGAYSIAHRKGYKSVTVIMDVDEISHMFTGQNKANWNNWTSDMFGKHVQQRALKRQYGLEFDDETITQNGSDTGVPEYEPKERKDITPNQEVIDTPDKNETKETPNEADDLRAEINTKFKQLGITTQKAANEYLKEHAPDVNPKTATGQEMIGLIELLDMNIDLKEAQQQNDDEPL